MPIIYGVSVEEMVESPQITRTSEGTQIIHTFTVASISPEWILRYFIPYGAPWFAHNAPHPDLPFLFVDEVSIDPDKKGIGKCRMHVRYKEWPLGLTPYAETWEWDTVARQEKIGSVKNASYQVHWPPTKDVGTVIGSNGERTEGVQVFRPSLSMRATKTWPYINPYGRLLLESMVGTVNHSYWVDYYPGEVLFTGAKIRKRSDGFIVIDYNFLISRWQGVQTISLFDGSTVDAQPAPWDYMWFKYIDQPVTTEGQTIIKRGIESAHIAQVYDYADFTIFGLVGPYG